MAYACLQFIQVLGIWLVLGSEDIYRTKQHHGLNDLVHDFSNIIQKPAAKFIDLNLDFEDAFDREASGVYKLIPYYMKIYPKDTNHGDRFIIQQNPFNGEFQLIKIFNYIYRKNVRSLFHPNKEIPQKKDLTTINSLHKYQTNMKALAKKNITLIEEIQKTKERSNNFKKNLQNKEKNLHENMEQEKRKMKEKKLKLKKENFQLKLKNKENEQNIYALQQTLAPKQSLIDEQKIMIEKLQLELSHLKYEKDCLKDENLNLTNQLKTTKENLNQEKIQNKKLQKQENEIQKVNENLQKTNENLHKINVKIQKKKAMKKQEKNFQETHEAIKVLTEEHLSKFLDFEELKERKYEDTLLFVQGYFESQYYDFTNTFPYMFMNLLPERQIRLEELFKNEKLENSNFEYEHALITYGFFKHVEVLRSFGIIRVPKEEIFDPQKLKPQILTIKIDTN